jgi:DNA polymerase III subunit delta
MVEIKAFEFDRLIQRGPLESRVFLIFGPDGGLVSERAEEIARKTGVALDDPFSLVRLDVGDLQGDNGRLLDEVNSIGLFGGERLIWIRGGSGEKQLSGPLQILAETPPEACYVIIEQGDLKKTASLRKTAASSRHILSVPCYSDDARAVSGLMDEVLGSHGLRIAPNARSLLATLLGGDRRASRAELEKLCLYCRNDGMVEEHHIRDIIGDASAISADDAVDAVLAGNTESFLQVMEKIASSKTPMFLVLQSCLRTFQLLDLMRGEMEGENAPLAKVMQSRGRHLHFRRKPIVERALAAWTSADIGRETNRINAAILQSRQRPALEDSIARQTLLSTALQAKRRLR